MERRNVLKRNKHSLRSY